MKALLKRLLPAAALEQWRAWRRLASQHAVEKENSRRIALRRASRTIGAEELARLLREAGVRSGGCIFVHSGVSRFNRVEGGVPRSLRRSRRRWVSPAT
jgi:hypothetical protein